MIRPLADVEQEHILHAIKFYNGNLSQAARALDVTLRTLYNKLYKWNVDHRQFWPEERRSCWGRQLRTNKEIKT